MGFGKRLAAVAAASVVGVAATAGPAAAASPMWDWQASWVTDVVGFWAGITPGTGLLYYFPAPGERVQMACGPVTDDDTMAYCVLDDTVFFSQSVAERIWYGTYELYPGRFAAGPAGDTGVIYLLAHEVAHNVQFEQGLYGDPRDPQDDPYPLRLTELHADCWSGVYLRAKAEAGQLEAGDLDEAVWAAARVGDFAYEDPQHHGTPEERVRAFSVGYDSGQPLACDAVLDDRF